MKTSSVASSRAVAPDIHDISLDGFLGDRLRGCIWNHVAKTDASALTDPYRWRTESIYWQTEFWGKWMHSAVPFAIMTGDPALRDSIESSTARVVAAQLPDGYLGNYREDARCGGGWDVWGCKYTMLGLLFHYDLAKSEKTLHAASRLCGYLMSVFGPDKRDIVTSGQYMGMASCSILEPVVKLWRRTGDPAHLAFAEYVVSQLCDHPAGPHLIRDAAIPVAARHPGTAPGYENLNPGLKAYEMMSCCQGLLDYGEATGDGRFLDAVAKTAESIAATEVNICGGASCVEHWYSGALRQHRPFMRMQETCVTTTWMRLCGTLLALTGDSLWADEIEKTFHNAYLGAMSPDGSFFASYSPLAGFRSYGQHHCKMHTNCCNSNGPRGFVAFLENCIQARGRDVFLNLYASGRFSISVPDASGGAKAVFQVFTLYPERGRVEMWYRGETPLDFTLNLRIPAWSEKTSVTLNGEPVGATPAGAYLPLSRTWTMGDVVVIDFDMDVRAHTLDDHVAFTAGPLALARDMRFGDGDIGECVRPEALADPNGRIPGAIQVRPLSDSFLMNAAIPLPMGAHRVNPQNALPDIVRFCDYASAGNTWDSSSSYRVWLPVERFEPLCPVETAK